MSPLTLLLLAGGLLGCASAPDMRLRRVILYQSGIGYFERSGRTDAEGVQLRLAAHEVDDVLTTLTVLDPDRPESAPAPSALIPRSVDGAQELTVGLGGAGRAVTLAYSAPTSAWRASYRLVLPEARGGDDAFLQAWAIVDNTTAEDWAAVDVTLATDAPLSFAVDLRTPRTVERPNVTGHHVPAIAFGPVRSELSTRTRDTDADGVLDVDDLCPDDAEDVDFFQDMDGCPDPDHDHDRIADARDQCPDEPETYNGTQDDDGCPDVGRVVISESRLQILEQVYFAAGSSRIPSVASPILDAIASTLRGNPEIARVEIEGHADVDEESPWLISAERAGVVRDALVARGVDAERLRARAHGQSRPVVATSSERNRRVAFQIAQATPEAAAPAPAGGVRAAPLARSAPATLPRVGSGGTRFPVTRAVSIPAGQSAMVTILHRPIRGEDVLLYRVDPSVPASEVHPFRAARFENRSGIDLVPGPVSLFAGGELVGEGLLDALRAGENAFIPYALDTSSRLLREVEEREVPSRVLGLEEGRVELERARVRRTRYAIEPGRRAPGRVFVRHARSPGYEPRDLPPRTESRPDALLVPLPIEPSRDVTLTVVERRPVRVTIDLRDDVDTPIGPYLEHSDLDPADRARLAPLLDERAALARIHEEASLLSRQLQETASRSAELRRSVEVLDERAGRSGAEVRRRMSERLEQSTRHGEQLSEQLATLRGREIEARARLRDAARGLRIDAR